MRGSEREEYAVGRVAVLAQQFKERGKVGRKKQLGIPGSGAQITVYLVDLTSKRFSIRGWGQADTAKNRSSVS